MSRCLETTFSFTYSVVAGKAEEVAATAAAAEEEGDLHNEEQSKYTPENKRSDL